MWEILSLETLYTKEDGDNSIRKLCLARSAKLKPSKSQKIILP